MGRRRLRKRTCAYSHLGCSEQIWDYERAGKERVDRGSIGRMDHTGGLAWKIWGKGEFFEFKER